MALGLAVMACGGSPDGLSVLTEGHVPDGSAVHSEALDAAPEEHRGETDETARPDEEPAPCFEVSGPVLEAWPSVGAKMAAAASAWGFDLREGPDCKIELLADTSWKTRWGRTELVDDTAVVWLNPEARIVAGPECSADDAEFLLLSVLVHEFGHLAGLPHSDCEDCAMDEGHDPCEVLRPSAAELAAL